LAELPFDDLLAALAHHGLRVPVDQRLQLLHVLTAAAAARPPEADDEGLLVDLVAAVVAKSPAERERVELAVGTLRPRVAVAPVVRVEEEPPPMGPMRPGWVGAVGAVILFTTAVLVVELWVISGALFVPPADEEPTFGAPQRAPPKFEAPREAPVAPTEEPPVGAPSEEAPPAKEPPADEPLPPEAPPAPDGTLELPVPQLRVTSTPALPRGWPAIPGLLLAALALQLRARLHRIPPAPPAPPPPVRARPAQEPPGPERPALLDRADQRALVYGVGRLIEPDPSSELDVPASAQATARRGGIPDLRFLPLCRPEVLALWVDLRAQDHGLERLAREMTQVLRQAGLPVERASYDLRHDVLEDEAGRRLSRPQADALDVTRLVLFTTPAALRRLRRAADGRSLQRALRRLAEHPHPLVACAPDPEVDDLLAARRLPRVDPQHAARAIADAAALRAPPALPDTSAVWAALCCLSPRPVPEPLALRLALAAGLKPDPAGWAALTALLPTLGTTLTPTPHDRARHLGWSAAGGLSTPLQAAWKELAAWLDADPSSAADRAWLDLWLPTPAPAAAALHTLLDTLPDDALRSLRQAVAPLIPADVAPTGDRRDELVHLPWSRADVRDDTTRSALARVGLGSATGVILFPEVQRPTGLRRLGVGVLAGAAAALLLLGLTPRPAAPPSITTSGWPTEEPLSTGVAPLPAASRAASGQIEAASPAPTFFAVTRWGAVASPVPTRWWPTTHRAEVGVAWEEQPCHLSFPGVDLYRCPTDEQRRPPPASRAPRSTVWLLGDPAARQALLDSGTADVVAVVQGTELPWPGDVAALCGWSGQGCGGRQGLVVAPDGLGDGRTGGAAVLDGLVWVLPGSEGVGFAEALDVWVLRNDGVAEALAGLQGPRGVEDVAASGVKRRGSAPFVVLPWGAPVTPQAPLDLLLVVPAAPLAVDWPPKAEPPKPQKTEPPKAEPPKPPEPEPPKPPEPEPPKPPEPEPPKPPEPEPEPPKPPVPPDSRECPRPDTWPTEPAPLDTRDLARQLRCAARDPQGWKQDVAWVRVPEGTATIGSKRGDPQAYPDEYEAWTIRLPSFEILRTEVTAGWYRDVMKKYGRTPAKADDWPVRGVDWFDAQTACERLGGRLPSEAEWEAATRAGTTTAWSFGDQEGATGRYAWYSGNADNRPHAVALLGASPGGLYDVHGNVWEWTASCHDSGGYTFPSGVDTTKTDPTLLTSVRDDCARALRGGAFWDVPRYLRSAFRNRDEPTFRLEDIGFRCVRGAARQLGR
jgi:formylglycine-generating enzyme required for sulfatase activity